MNAQPIHFKPSEGFRERAKAVVDNPFLRQSFRGAMDFLIRPSAPPSSRIAEELESLRTLGEHIRQYNLGKLPDLLVQLEENLTRNGIHVHWAETPDEANAIILGICKKHSAKLMVKGKSMVSEEIELNHAAEAAGIECARVRHGRVHRPARRREAVAHHHAGDPQDQGGDRRAVRTRRCRASTTPTTSTR